MMRLILIDHARESLSQRRGGALQHVPLNEDMPWVNIGSPEILQPGILERQCAGDAALMAELRALLTACEMEERHRGILRSGSLDRPQINARIGP